MHVLFPRFVTSMQTLFYIILVRNVLIGAGAGGGSHGRGRVPSGEVQTAQHEATGSGGGRTQVGVVQTAHVPATGAGGSSHGGGRVPLGEVQTAHHEATGSGGGRTIWFRPPWETPS